MMNESHYQKERFSNKIDMNLLRKFIQPHLEHLCKDFLQSVIKNKAHQIKMSTLEIHDTSKGLDLARRLSRDTLTLGPQQSSWQNVSDRDNKQ